MAVWQIEGARIDEETPFNLRIKSRAGGWLRIGLFFLLFFGLGSVFLVEALNSDSGNQGLGIFGAILCILGFLAPLNGSTAIKVNIDSLTRTLTVERQYLGGSRPWAKPKIIQAGQGVVSLLAAPLVRTSNLSIRTTSGDAIALLFGYQTEEAQRTLAFLQQKLGLEDGSVAPAQSTTNAAVTQSAMMRDLRSWGVWLLITGLVSVSSIFWGNVFSPTWGVVLIGLGLSAFVIREPAMFVVFGVALVWAGFTNLLSGSGSFMFGSLLQFYLAFQQFRSFRLYRQAETKLAEQPALGVADTSANAGRAKSLFPWASIGFAGLGAGAFVLTFVVVVLFTSSQSLSETTLSIVSWIEGLSVGSGIIGFGLGLASILSGFRFKVIAGLGMLIGLVAPLGELGLILLSFIG